MADVVELAEMLGLSLADTITILARDWNDSYED